MGILRAGGEYIYILTQPRKSSLEDTNLLASSPKRRRTTTTTTSTFTTYTLTPVLTTACQLLLLPFFEKVSKVVVEQNKTRKSVEKKQKSDIYVVHFF